MLDIGGGNTPAKTAVKDVTTATFRADVIADSAKQPVLVDFWAPWCGPCKQLAPVIEKVVAATKGKVKLVKMNIDDHPEIAGQLGIQSIPAVIAFQNGQPVDGFMGAVPESQIKGFVERLIGPVEGGSETMLAEAEAALAGGDIEAAAGTFQAVLQSEPENPVAIGGLVRALVALGELEDARAILAELPEGIAGAPIAAAQAALDLADQAAGVGDLRALEAKVAANPDDHQARLDLALGLNAANRRDEAVDALIAIIRRDRTWNDGQARTQLLQFFDAWGLGSPDSAAGRRKLSTVLYS